MSNAVQVGRERADLHSECRHEATPQMWQEVYLSALLRAILYADDANYVSLALDRHLSIADAHSIYSDSLDSASSTLSPPSRPSNASSRPPRQPSSRVSWPIIVTLTITDSCII